MLILCEGKVAKEPYVMPFTGQKVYSVEELCYYLYHNIYTINEDFFQSSLARWLREETEHPVLADKIQDMMEGEPKLKDLVVTILCGCDYYREDEIRQLVKVMDDIANLPVHKKKKIKADNLLRAGFYGRSLLEYRKLLYGSFAVNFSPEEYGDILHNQGIAHFYTSSFEEARRDFKEAFVRNNKKNSLKHYLWLLLMEDREQEFEREAISLGMSPKEIQGTLARYKEVLAEIRITEQAPGELERYKKQFVQSLA